jgi:CheY-like chemotaxis protein
MDPATSPVLGHDVLPAASAEAALEILATVSPQLVLTDVHMGAP